MNYSEAIIKKDDFLTYLDIERNVALNTYKSYQYDLNQFFTFWNNLNNQKENIAYSMQEAVPKFFMHLHNLKVQKSSIGRKVACFQSFVKYLHRNNIAINLKLTAPRLSKKLPTYLTTDEITYMLDKLPDDIFLSKRPVRDRAILETLYATGFRCSELTHIKFNDINFDNLNNINEKNIIKNNSGDITISNNVKIFSVINNFYNVTIRAIQYLLDISTKKNSLLKDILF